MRQAAGALLRLGRLCAAGSSPLLRSNPEIRNIQSSFKQWPACISHHQPRPALQSFHAAQFSTSAASSKDGQDSPAAAAAEDKAEPVCKSGKDEKKVKAEKGDKGDGGGEKKSGDGEKKVDEKKVPETAEQKLLKEVKKLEQVLREKDSLLEEKDEMAKELKDNVLRAYAELENFRERSKRDQESSRKFAVQSFSKDLLDVADNLTRALSAAGQKDGEELKKALDTLLEGVKMTEKQLTQVLKKFGVERFDPTGEAFDPNVHLAVCEVTDPSKPAGTVANVFKVGYLLHERVLRPAEVAVVKAAEAAA